MSVVAVAFFMLGFGASWVAGRFVGKGAAVVQGGAIGICGVAALVVGMPELWEDNLVWALIALLIYGLVGALIYRSGQSARERAE